MINETNSKVPFEGGFKTVKIEGMHCQNCATRLEAILNAVDGFSASVDLATKTAKIESKREIEDDELKNMIEFAGYTVVEIQ